MFLFKPKRENVRKNEPQPRKTTEHREIKGLTFLVLNFLIFFFCSIGTVRSGCGSAGSTCRRAVSRESTVEWGGSPLVCALVAQGDPEAQEPYLAATPSDSRLFEVSTAHPAFPEDAPGAPGQGRH